MTGTLTPLLQAAYSMQMNDDSHEAISDRLKAVTAQIGSYEGFIEVLRQERDELLIALRVIDRFSGDKEHPGERKLLLDEPAAVAADTGAKAQEPAINKRKPRDAPTVPEMILDVLAVQKMMSSGEGMEPKDLVAEIRNRWWRDAPSTSIGPIAWRMFKEGRLKKVGAAYVLPNDETPAGDTAGASSLEPETEDGFRF